MSHGDEADPTRVTEVQRELRDVLEDTFGVMLYQEDILKVAHAVAGFTLEEADQLRRAISKDRTRTRIRALREAFVLRAVDRGSEEEKAAAVWSAVENFIGYSFCKAHAATYGRLAWQAVWLKSRYAAEFMAAVLANEGGFYEARAYLEEARRLGVKIHLPDVNRSGRTYRRPIRRRLPLLSLDHLPAFRIALQLVLRKADVSIHVGRESHQHRRSEEDDSDDRDSQCRRQAGAAFDVDCFFGHCSLHPSHRQGARDRGLQFHTS